MADQSPKSRLERAFDALKGRVEEARAPSDLYARIAGQIDQGAGKARTRRLVLSATGIAIVLLGTLAAWSLFRPVEQAGFRVESASSDFRSHATSDGILVADSGEASLRVAELSTRIVLTGRASLKREVRGVRVIRGTAAFEVEPRRAPPLIVYVSGGRIEVLGTRFTVIQGDGTGEVSLSNGSIRFVDPEGQATLLRPGERLQWPPPHPVIKPPAPPQTIEPPVPPPIPAPSRPPPKPTSPAPRQPAPPAAGSQALPPAPQPAEVTVQEQKRILEEIDRLRIRREDDLLVRRLDEILSEGVSEPLRERLSFERCDVLAHRASEKQRACSEIARHLTTYTKSEYTSRLQQIQHSLGCIP